MPFSITFIILGLGFICIPIISTSKVKRLKKTGKQLDATVAEVRKISSYSKGTGKAITYRPVLQYCIDNKDYRQDANIAHAEPHYYVGQRVQIYCNPATPDKIAIAGTESIRDSALFIVIGVIALTVGVILRFA